MKLTCLLIAALCCLAASTARGAPGVLWLEAEQFADTGGWVNDPQFVDIMGSPYLLANGVGHPVQDAVTGVRVPEAGTYRLWVRCKDWLPEHSPGQFQVLVGGEASEITFGIAETDAWQWVGGGAFELQAGEVEVRLRDLSGWWARCDAVVLTTGAKPSDDPETLAEQRRELGGLSADVEQPRPYDLVVTGGGLAGCAAAIAAARHGCSVALIQDRPVLGGNTSVEIQVPVGGDQSREPLDPRETGIAEELDPGPGRGRGRSDLIEEVVRGQGGVELYLNTRATDVRMSDESTIASVLAANVHTGRRYEFRGRLFADCTGDGWIGFWAGADYRLGREARSEFNEPLAPETADTRTMGNGLHNGRVVTRPEPTPFETPPWAYQWESCDDFETASVGWGHISGEAPPENFTDFTRGLGRHPSDPNGALFHTWWVEVGGMRDILYDAEHIRDELFRVHMGLWGHVKNHCSRFSEQNVNREVTWINHIMGKRESRRLMGDYIMTQRDYIDKTVHPDSVAYGGWTIDIHHPRGFWKSGRMYYHAYRQKVSIPYRSLYSRNIANLFMAGRDISVTHVALGGVRVMRTCCLMGEAVGTAAAIARQHDTTPRGVYQEHLAELQQTLVRDGCYLMGVKNADPRDLALKATVTASSSAEIDDPAAERKLPNRGTVHDLTTSRAVMFTAPQDRLDSIELFLRSGREGPTPMEVTLCRARALGDFASGEELATATAEVPGKSEGWVTFPLSATLESGQVYFAWLPAADGLQWDLYPYFPEGTWRAYGGPDWHPMTHCYKHRLSPGGEPAPPEGWRLPGKIALAPENAVNGWNRAVHGTPNSWGPDPEQALPQWIELRLAERARFSAVHISFQTPSMAAADYSLDVPDGDGWRTVLAVEDNSLRRRVHRFDAVEADRLRLTILRAPDGGEPPRVCEIRVYGAE
ncbi:MAG: FAD-dependent oxidoreductase [Armatimonadota bacterium]|jgi:hypothetical protein